VTDQRALKANRSRRFDWTHCRPYASACSAFASVWCGANAFVSFNLSDDLGIVFYGALSAISAGAAVYWGLRAWWPDLEVEQEAAKAAEKEREAEERREHQRRWSAAAERVEYLKAERARRRAAKKSFADVQAELSALTHAMLRGEV
jgi:hypothetical protein